MKNISVLILIGFLSLNCSKDGNYIDSNLIGNWGWVKSSGGISYHIETPESTGKTMKFEITDTTIKSYINDNLEYESKYFIKSENINGEKIQIISFKNQLIPLQIINTTETTLTLNEYNVSDGFQYEYMRN